MCVFLGRYFFGGDKGGANKMRDLVSIVERRGVGGIGIKRSDKKEGCEKKEREKGKDLNTKGEKNADRTKQIFFTSKI
jgi:hypothetical protein